MYINICTSSPEAMPIAGGRLKVYMRGCTFTDMATHTGSKKSMNTKNICTQACTPIYIFAEDKETQTVSDISRCLRPTRPRRKNIEWRTKKVKKRIKKKKEREWCKTEECKNSVEIARKHREMLKRVCCCRVRQTASSIWRCFRPISVPSSGREKKQKKKEKKKC